MRIAKPLALIAAAAVLLSACGSGAVEVGGGATSSDAVVGSEVPGSAVPGSGSAEETTSAASTAGELRPVSVILDWSPNTNHTGLYLAQEAGYFAEQGLDVSLIEPGETDALQLVAAGQAEFGLTVAESLVPARTEGLPVVSIATVIQHNTSSLVSLAEDGITRPKDLEGKTYGGYEGPLEKALIDALVACDGGDPATVNHIALPGFDFRIGLTEDYYDTAWIFNGWDGIRLRELDGLDINTIDFLDHTDCIPDWYTPLIATSESTLAEDPDLVRSFLAGAAQGYAEAMRDPAAGVEALMAAAPELDRELVSRSAEYLATVYAESPEAWGRQDAEVWRAFIDFLTAHELAPADFDVDAAWDGSFLTS